MKDAVRQGSLFNLDCTSSRDTGTLYTLSDLRDKLFESLQSWASNYPVGLCISWNHIGDLWHIQEGTVNSLIW